MSRESEVTTNVSQHPQGPLWQAPQSAAVIGAGAWGTAIANHLAKKGIDVSLWVYEPELCSMISAMQENVLYLPGVSLRDNVSPSSNIEQVVSGAPVVIFVTPSQVLRSVAGRAAASLADDAVVVCCSKGIENGTLMLLPDVLEDVLGRQFSQNTAFVSGPSFANEVAADHPTSVAVAARDMRVAEHVQHIFETDVFFPYVNPDVTGVEVCGAVKNVIAIAVGICEGSGHGYNTRAALITRGLAEMMKLGTALGANPLTFSGLAGMGDLILTCTSGLSRNKTLGLSLGRGEKLADILSTVHTVAEGVDTAKSVRKLALTHGLQMPICSQVYDVLHEGSPPAEFVARVAANDGKHDIGRVQLK